VSVSMSLLLIKATNSSIMTIYILSPTGLPKIHNQESSMIGWCDLCHGCICTLPSFDLAYSIIHIDLAAFLPFSFTFFLLTTLFFNNIYKTSLYNILHSILKFRIIILSKMPPYSINAHHHCQFPSTGCSALPNEFYQPYDADDSLLTS